MVPINKFKYLIFNCGHYALINMKREGGGKEGVLECSTFRYEIKIIALHFVYVFAAVFSCIFSINSARNSLLFAYLEIR